MNNNNKLEFNSQLDVYKILISYFKPLYDACRWLEKYIEMVENGTSYYTFAYTTCIRLQLGMKKMDWPAHLLDLRRIFHERALISI